MALGCRVLLVVVAFLLADFVLAYPVCAKDEPKYVGDFPDIAKFPLKKLNFPRK